MDLVQFNEWLDTWHLEPASVDDWQDLLADAATGLAAYLPNAFASAAALIVGLAVALGEEHERAPVALGAGDEVHAWAGPGQEGVGGHEDRRHAGRGGDGRGLAFEAVALEQGERPLVVIGRRVGDPGIAPGRYCLLLP